MISNRLPAGHLLPPLPVDMTDGSLKKAYSEVQILQGLIPICSSCKKIRDDKGFWNQLETYIEKHSHAMFSHGICPSCTKKLYGDETWYHEIGKKK